MASKIEVTCIVKTNRFDPHERIQSIGGKNADGSRWKLSEEEAIKGIETGKWQFYVNQSGHTVNVIIARSAAGHKYLKTENDGLTPNNLLSLATCPI
jgi:hypothetical protein